MWLKKLNIALVEKDIDKLKILLDDVPHLSDMKEIEEALFLLHQATTLVQTLKDETQVTMQQLKKNIDYMNSTEPLGKGNLDITS